jgi:acyl-CoA synthetase (AMP-forming)/AMP-acid ligase II
MTPESTASLLDRGADARPAIAWGEVTIDRGSLRKLVEELARRFEGHEGQPIVIVAPNVPALVVGIFAAWRAGCVAVPLNGRVRRYELERVFADAEPWAVVSLEAHAGFFVAEVARELALGSPALELCLVVDELGEVVGEFRTGATERDRLDEEVASIMYTSGTTGEPKGAIERHSKGLRVAQSFAERLGPHADAPCGFAIPVSHSFGLACLQASVGAGALVVLADGGGTGEALQLAMRRHGVVVLHGPPALFSRLLHMSGEAPQWRTGFIGGSPVPPELVEALDRRGATMLGQWGLSETGSVAACRLDDPSAVRYRTVGRAFPGYEVRAVPVAGMDADELQVRSRYIWPSLLGRPWSEEEMTPDGWLRTGDLGDVDDDGVVTLVGRKKDVVHTGGFTVHPAEVERFIQAHPDVAAVVVVGIPHADLGEALAAFIVLNAGTSFDRRGFIGYCRAGVAGYKVPYVLEVVSELPLLASGKPDRLALASGVARR